VADMVEVSITMIGVIEVNAGKINVRVGGIRVY